MSDQESSTLVFFIPGIMGSTLRHNGVGEYGQLIKNEEIWGTDIQRNQDILATNAKALLKHAEPGEVIRFFKKEKKIGHGHIKFKIYEDLLEFCTNQETGIGLKENENFFTFPYDWREDNFITAKKLAKFILDKIKCKSIGNTGNIGIRIIAHSMGGIVSRIMLLTEREIAQRTDLFVQIASPITGAASAYYTLKERPRFSKYFDISWTIYHHLNPKQRANLLDVVRTFESLYQLLPPNEVITLYSKSGEQFAALDSNIWASRVIEIANKAHNLLKTPLQVETLCVYSNQYDTEMIYVVDEHFDIIAAEKPTFVKGDGTVTCRSAFACSDDGCRCLIESKPSEHTEICFHAELFDILKNRFL